MNKYKSIIIKRGPKGWGGPLTIVPTQVKNKILVVTTECELIDGFKIMVPEEEVVLAIIDCGGIARCGIYPKNGIPTMNLNSTGKSGPLSNFITEELYVSDVKENTIFLYNIE